MKLMDVLTTEPGLTALGALLGTVWTFFKTSDWYVRLRRRRFDRALLALEAGVQQTYESYVHAIREGREDGSLTREERRQAREIARQTAIEFGKTRGIDVLRELGEEYVDLWIARLVRRSKAGS